MNKQFFVTGIGTNVGKTVVSAILAESLKATYWKPIQAGDLDQSDSLKVASLTSDEVTVLPELFRLNTPASPHFAAKIDGVELRLSDFELPPVDGNFVVEGAGGLMVPLNDDGELYIDLIEKFGLPVILVSQHYLGSINHTLLSLEALQQRNISIAGIVFVGEENKATEEIILNRSQVKMLARIPILKSITVESIGEVARGVCI